MSTEPRSRSVDARLPAKAVAAAINATTSALAAIEAGDKLIMNNGYEEPRFTQSADAAKPQAPTVPRPPASTGPTPPHIQAAIEANRASQMRKAAASTPRPNRVHCALCSPLRCPGNPPLPCHPQDGRQRPRASSRSGVPLATRDASEKDGTPSPKPMTDGFMRPAP